MSHIVHSVTGTYYLNLLTEKERLTHFMRWLQNFNSLSGKVQDYEEKKNCQKNLTGFFGPWANGEPSNCQRNFSLISE